MAVLKRVTLFVLLAMLVSPAAAAVAHVHIETPGLKGENRELATLPDLGWKALWNGSYFRGLDAYVDDHFGLRNVVIRTKQTLERRLLKKTRRDLFAGKNRFTFYTYMASRYQPETMRYLSKDRVVRVVQRLRTRLAKRGIEFLFILFPNKELIYYENVPDHWRLVHDLGAHPYYQACAKLEKRGTNVWVLAPELFDAKKTLQVFTPVEENHISPEAFFLVMQRLLTRVGTRFGTPVEPPSTFPKIRSRVIGAVPGYRTNHYVNTNYGRPAPWARTAHGKHGWVYEYVNPDGVLPETVAYSDSFLETLTREFGPAFLPYFRSFSLRWGDYDETAITPTTRLVIVATSDQNMENTLDGLQSMLARRW
jgi:hypothetical protein